MISESFLSFLQNFYPIHLHYRVPNIIYNPWVFWSESEGCDNSSSSADHGTPMIHDQIKSALSNLHFPIFSASRFFGQFWAPVTIGGRWVLSTSGQPFALRDLCNDFAKDRLFSEKYKYNIDEFDVDPEHMIVSGGPATAFLNCLTSISKLQGFLLDSDNDRLNVSVMVPICFPSQSNCIGVLEFTLDHSQRELASFLFRTVNAIKVPNAGLDVFYVQHLIPYKVTLPN
ncbi:hypothetical protein Hanom_Chr02g00144981 [Helianthus anomalus]